VAEPRLHAALETSTDGGGFLPIVSFSVVW
jgi:hypothetical protein